MLWFQMADIMYSTKAGSIHCIVYRIQNGHHVTFCDDIVYSQDSLELDRMPDCPPVSWNPFLCLSKVKQLWKNVELWSYRWFILLKNIQNMIVAHYRTLFTTQAGFNDTNSTPYDSLNYRTTTVAYALSLCYTNLVCVDVISRVIYELHLTSSRKCIEAFEHYPPYSRTCSSLCWLPIS